MNNGIIYIIRNRVNNKVYIGQTIQKLERRWQAHICASKTKDTHLYKAMRAYGTDQFFIEVLEDNVSVEDLNQKEIDYIKKYNSYNDGYNSTLGGESGMPGAPVYQYDLLGNFIASYSGANEAERATGCLHQNILKTCKGIFSQTGGYYWSFLKADKIQIQYNSKREKPVGKLNEDNKVIQTYTSVKSVADELNVESTHVSRAIRKGYRLHGKRF